MSRTGYPIYVRWVTGTSVCHAGAVSSSILCLCLPESPLSLLSLSRFLLFPIFPPSVWLVPYLSSPYCTVGPPLPPASFPFPPSSRPLFLLLALSSSLSFSPPFSVVTLCFYSLLPSPTGAARETFPNSTNFILFLPLVNELSGRLNRQVKLFGKM